MSNKFRIQDNLYEYVNHDDLAKKEIPDDLPSVGGFVDLNLDVEKKMMNEFENLSKDMNSISDKYLKAAITIYKKALENTKDPFETISYLLPKLEIFNKVNNISEFNNQLLNLYKEGVNLPFVFEVTADMKSSNDNSLCVLGPSTILPDTTYYKDNHPSKNQLITIWTDMVKKIFSYFKNIDEDKLNKKIINALKFDEEIAKIVKSKVEWADYIKNYNPMKFEEVCKLFGDLQFEPFVKSIFEKTPDSVIVYDPNFLKSFIKLFNEKNLNLYLDWAYIKYVINNCGLLCEDLRILSGTYDRALTGAKAPSSLKKFAYRLAGFGLLAEPVGIYFGKKYLGDKAKQDVISLVKELIKAYKQRLSENDWLSKQTINKAILKLDKMVLKIGYPDELSNFYKNLKLNLENKLLIEIVDDISNQKRDFENAQLFKKVDKSLWYMPGHMVNACYNPSANDITFPAAILQEPFYSINQSRSKNYGGIGTVIGHEISHAFDNNGAQCDENGNLNNWWTKQDYEKFKAKTKEMIDQFEGLPLGEGKVNGTLVVSENIADLGGVASSLQAMEKELKDFSYQDFFINFAKIWAQKARPEYQQLLLSVDVHAPTYWRANKQPQNFEQWYETFGVKETDGMYLAPNKRIKIW